MYKPLSFPFLARTVSMHNGATGNRYRVNLASPVAAVLVHEGQGGSELRHLVGRLAQA